MRWWSTRTRRRRRSLSRRSCRCPSCISGFCGSCCSRSRTELDVPGAVHGWRMVYIPRERWVPVSFGLVIACISVGVPRREDSMVRIWLQALFVLRTTLACLDGELPGTFLVGLCQGSAKECTARRGQLDHGWPAEASRQPNLRLGLKLGGPLPYIRFVLSINLPKMCLELRYLVRTYLKFTCQPVFALAFLEVARCLITARAP